MSCPLYKKLKNSGISFYCFPSSAEDISAAYQNSNYKMYFSKFVLLNFPKQNLIAGTTSNPIIMDFDNSFEKSVNYTSPTNFNDQIIESLRNYVANQEVVIKESRLNNNSYYYDNNALETTTEKIFFKWAKKLKLIDFEPAIPDDEYFSNLIDFQRNNLTDDEYFPEYLWKEREIIPYDSISFYETGSSTFTGYLEIKFNGKTNFKAGDKVKIFNISNSNIYTLLPGSETEDGYKIDVLEVIPQDDDNGDRIVVNFVTTISEQLETTGQIELVYNRFVQYLGEITGISNVQEANRNYTEVYAHIPDHTGLTPDILFRTLSDVNYKPNLVFPILPSQYQPEILGAELFSSPIVSNPQNYPGSYFAQFDTPDFTYETSTGDSLRRSGNYYGVTGDINNPIINSDEIDGITIDFNTNHYVKMNIFNKTLTNFDQFNALEVNNETPSDFEFNAILWYYTVEKSDLNNITTRQTNLYGISFLDNPDNNKVEEEIGTRFPVYTKLVSNGSQDGTSYAFSLNLNFNIENDNPQQSYNPEAINSLFSMNLFNKAMSRLSSVNDSFLNLLSEQGKIMDEIDYVKQLLYTQTDISTINSKISNLENLLRLYSTNQIVDTDSIIVVENEGTPKTISLYNNETKYSYINNIKTTDLYDSYKTIPINISINDQRNLLLNIVNNDNTNISFDEKLAVVIEKDLFYKQSIDINITGDPSSTQNKKLDIFINSRVESDNNITESESLLIGSIDLPVFYNNINSTQNSSYLWSDFRFNIDFNQTIQYTSDNKLEIPISENKLLLNNSIKPGDTLTLNNLFIGTSSIYDFSGQYTVDSLVGVTSSYLILDVSNNHDFVSYADLLVKPFYIHGTNSTLLSNLPYFSLNKGKNIKITRINSSDVPVSEKYKIIIEDIK